MLIGSREYVKAMGLNNEPDITKEYADMYAKREEKYDYVEIVMEPFVISFRCWLHKNLIQYRNSTIVNLDEKRIEYKGEKYSTSQLIDMMIERLEFSFSTDYDMFDDNQYDYVNEIQEIFAVALPYLWG